MFVALLWVGLEAVDVLILYSRDKLVTVVGFAYSILIFTHGMVGVYEVEVELSR